MAGKDLVGTLLGKTTDLAGEATQSIQVDWTFVAIGIVLIIAAAIIIWMLGKIVINSILGVVAWAILVFVFKMEMSLLPSLAVSAIFGLAGVGVILVLKFFGINI